MADVRVRMGFTLNLGNMQFARTDVELSEEIRLGLNDTPEAAYTRARDFALEAVHDSLVQLTDKLEAEGWIPKVN